MIFEIQPSLVAGSILKMQDKGLGMLPQRWTFIKMPLAPQISLYQTQESKVALSKTDDFFKWFWIIGKR
jgi:hypothetical protein